MLTINIFSIFYQNLIQTSLIEFVAVIFGLLSVWYARNENLLVYPTGLVNVGLYVYICFIAKLYADMGINVFYFIMSIYGWYNWGRKDENKKHISISRCTIKQHLISLFMLGSSFAILYYILTEYTDSTVPVLDSLTTAIFIVGMWLQTLKKIENWIYWIIGDSIVIPLFLYKNLAFTGIQFLIFLGIALSGYLEWRKKIKHAENN
jgi:nicotinamide mononucleotide transporter